MNIENFEILPSTQDYIKEKRALGEDLIVTAKAQTGGKGTKGRAFSSFEGGVYLSKLSFYENFPAKEAFKIMAGAAVAVCETLASFGLKALVKWPNDIFVNDKKIAGILIENTLSGKNIASSIVGIGLNVNNSLPAELLEIATSMQAETGKTFSVEEVRARLIEALSRPLEMEKYLSYLGYMGREVTLLIGDERIPATLLFVDNEGGLTVEIEGEKRRLTAAEVSIRL
jgi:BirA family biotin operon repressor/biotin-[acetyl-CoA-carboxylase] ligase